MARRKIETLRDAVIAAAREWERLSHLDPNDWSVFHEAIRSSDALHDAIAALNEYLDPIVDTPGNYVEGSPETSRNSAVAFKPLSGKVRRGIVNEIYSVHHYPSKGLSCAELMARLRQPHQTVSGAISFLTDAGWLIDSGYRRMAPSKREQVVWQLSPAGLAKMQEN